VCREAVEVGIAAAAIDANSSFDRELISGGEVGAAAYGRAPDGDESKNEGRIIVPRGLPRLRRMRRRQARKANAANPATINRPIIMPTIPPVPGPNPASLNLQVLLQPPT